MGILGQHARILNVLVRCNPTLAYPIRDVFSPNPLKIQVDFGKNSDNWKADKFLSAQLPSLKQFSRYAPAIGIG